MAVSTKGWGGPLTSNNMNQGGFPIVFSSQTGGYKSVQSLSALYQIPDHILSENISKDDDTGNDALGQLWYVKSEGCFYQLINWNSRRNASGWRKHREAGQKSVVDTNELYLLKDYDLATDIQNGTDAIGQLWYVKNEECFYQLINWNNRKNENGWQIFSAGGGATKPLKTFNFHSIISCTEEHLIINETELVVAKDGNYTPDTDNWDVFFDTDTKQFVYAYIPWATDKDTTNHPTGSSSSFPDAVGDMTFVYNNFDVNVYDGTNAKAIKSSDYKYQSGKLITFNDANGDAYSWNEDGTDLISYSQYATQDYVDKEITRVANKISDLVSGAPEAFDTLKEVGEFISDNQSAIESIADVREIAENKLGVDDTKIIARGGISVSGAGNFVKEDGNDYHSVTIQIDNNGITSNKIQDGAVVASKIENNIIEVNKLTEKLQSSTSGSALKFKGRYVLPVEASIIERESVSAEITNGTYGVYFLNRPGGGKFIYAQHPDSFDFDFDETADGYYGETEGTVAPPEVSVHPNFNLSNTLTNSMYRFEQNIEKKFLNEEDGKYYIWNEDGTDLILKDNSDNINSLNESVGNLTSMVYAVDYNVVTPTITLDYVVKDALGNNVAGQSASLATSNITAEKGQSVFISNLTYKWSTTSGYKDPTTVLARTTTGVTTNPAAWTNVVLPTSGQYAERLYPSDSGSSVELKDNTTYRIVIGAPKFGLVADKTTGKITPASGLDETYDSLSISFTRPVYFGKWPSNTEINASNIKYYSNANNIPAEIDRSGVGTVQFTSASAQTKTIKTESGWKWFVAWPKTFGSDMNIKIGSAGDTQTELWAKSTIDNFETDAKHKETYYIRVTNDGGYSNGDIAKFFA